MRDITLLPLNGYILVQPSKETIGTLLLSETADKKPQKGKVIVISHQPDKSDFGVEWICPVEVGDEVFYRNWGSELFSHEGEDLVLVRNRDIVAKI